MRRRLLIVLSLIACGSLIGCGEGRPSGDGGPSNTGSGVIAPQPPERLRVQVLETLPHDKNAFTQGFEISRGTLYEGTGLAGRSSLRATDMTSGKELVRVKLPAPLFGEGITVTESVVWQLTWQDGVAIKRNPRTLAELGRVSYAGEGWGLCHQADRERLVMSDG